MFKEEEKPRFSDLGEEIDPPITPAQAQAAAVKEKVYPSTYLETDIPTFREVGQKVSMKIIGKIISISEGKKGKRSIGIQLQEVAVDDEQENNP